MSDAEQFEVNLAEDVTRAGVWRVEVFDEDGAIFIAVFNGANAKQIAGEWATWKYGSFDEVGPADRSKATIITSAGTYRPKPRLRLVTSDSILTEGGEG